MSVHELSRKYATAVFSLALEKWLETLDAVQDKLASDPQLSKRLQDTSRTFGDKQKDLDAIIPADASQEARNFLYMLLKNDDIGILDQVLDDLGRMTEGGPQVRVAYVTTAVELPEQDKEQFRQKLRSQYGKDLEFSFEVDPEILGGAIVQIGDRVIDGSLATRLEAMSNNLGVKQ